MPDLALARQVRADASALAGSVADEDAFFDLIGDASLVLVGEATHGTHEFYRERARITRRLIEERGFNAVAVEADWPDAYRVNRCVRGEGEEKADIESLAGFERFPSWMWRNTDVLDFIGWLRDHNENVGTVPDQTGFYGLDLYSLHKSMNEVIDYLDRADREAADRVRAYYNCLERFGPDPQNYGMLAGRGISDSCREEVVRTLVDLRSKEAEYLSRDGLAAADAFFFAEQNARLVRNAEQYYRDMFRSDRSSWNTRDEHMMETLVELLAHLQSHHGRAKVVVWAHNSHLGDARATEMGRHGEVNLGQLVREAFPRQCRLIGFTTYIGTVTAASAWHLPGRRRAVRPALDGSYEELFHRVGVPRFWLDLTAKNSAVEALRPELLERAIGVIYRPDTERQSHYFKACLPDQFDAVIHIDQTRAVEPLDRGEHWLVDEAPETFPAGL